MVSNTHKPSPQCHLSPVCVPTSLDQVTVWQVPRLCDLPSNWINSRGVTHNWPFKPRGLLEREWTCSWLAVTTQHVLPQEGARTSCTWSASSHPDFRCWPCSVRTALHPPPCVTRRDCRSQCLDVVYDNSRRETRDARAGLWPACTRHNFLSETNVGVYFCLVSYVSSVFYL